MNVSLPQELNDFVKNLVVQVRICIRGCRDDGERSAARGEGRRRSVSGAKEVNPLRLLFVPVARDDLAPAQNLPRKRESRVWWWCALVLLAILAVLRLSVPVVHFDAEKERMYARITCAKAELQDLYLQVANCLYFHVANRLPQEPSQSVLESDIIRNAYRSWRHDSARADLRYHAEFQEVYVYQSLDRWTAVVFGGEKTPPIRSLLRG